MYAQVSLQWLIVVCGSLPLQDFPLGSRRNPLEQPQTYEPTVFLQSWSHSSTSSLHSLTSSAYHHHCIVYHIVEVMIILLTFACIAIIAESVAIVAEAVMGTVSVVADLLTNVNSVTTLIDIWEGYSINFEKESWKLNLSYSINLWPMQLLAICVLLQ